MSFVSRAVFLVTPYMLAFPSRHKKMEVSLFLITFSDAEAGATRAYNYSIMPTIATVARGQVLVSILTWWSVSIRQGQTHTT